MKESREGRGAGQGDKFWRQSKGLVQKTKKNTRNKNRRQAVQERKTDGNRG